MSNTVQTYSSNLHLCTNACKNKIMTACLTGYTYLTENCYQSHQYPCASAVCFRNRNTLTNSYLCKCCHFNQTKPETLINFMAVFFQFIVSCFQSIDVACRCKANIFLITNLFLAIIFTTRTEATPIMRDNFARSFELSENSNVTDKTQVSRLHEMTLPLSKYMTDPPTLVFSSSANKSFNGIIIEKRTRRAARKNKDKKDRTQRKKNKKNRKSKKKKIRPSQKPKPVHRHPPTPPLNTHGFPRRDRLYNKIGNSFHLTVWKNGNVGGENSVIRSPYSILEIQGVGKGGIVTIKGVKAKKFICASRTGRIRAKRRFDAKRCLFREEYVANNQNTYGSLSCSKCYLNLNKKGEVKRLKKGNPKLKNAQFLPLPLLRRSPRHNSDELNQANVSSAEFNKTNKLHATRITSSSMNEQDKQQAVANEGINDRFIGLEKRSKIRSKDDNPLQTLKSIKLKKRLRISNRNKKQKSV